MPFLSRLSNLPKSALVFAPLLLLSYTQGTQALSAQTSQVIHGSAPYLTFDGGITKSTNVDELLFIILPDGTKLTPSTNTSSFLNPIRLSNIKNTLGDISMVVPPSKNSINLNDLIIPSNWGDDDGDGQGVNGVTITGSISVSFNDKDSNTVNRDDALSICNAPYRISLESTNGTLTTQYGVPRSSTFSESSVDYYINPNADVSICSVRPFLKEGSGQFAGPSNIWNPYKGFLVQSTNPSSYNLNFPSTGADSLYFDLDIVGVDASQLTWSPVSHGGVTATATIVMASEGWIDIGRGKQVTRVKLTGPRADNTQIQSSNPSSLTVPPLPQTFELEGRDSSGNVVVKYGFVLKQWFVNRGDQDKRYSDQLAWCNSLGYRLAKVKDLTNAVCSGWMSESDCQGAVGATPSSSDNVYKRHIGAGFFTEWGGMHFYVYADAGFVGNNYWTSDASGSDQFSVYSSFGQVSSLSTSSSGYAVCTTP
ncbi:hypothetical protein GQ597_02075 [Gilliamella sp. Pra-s65]|uniref:hypothetical protein n=1 Tax=unclassified Gilliamella TaxID=2685620 RepID=UPI00136600F0|nr:MULTISPECIES: hypothetical protein [unclassified Gilliamella]MWN89502.1 hypothetical protein [Gilliamella sp. Pra-s65]MWP72510.1 hypothetical protein [Gilliamella sp. Pra-s52]